MTESTLYKDPRSGFSRRDFLRGSGAVAAAALAADQLAAAQKAETSILKGQMTIDLTVNGTAKKAQVEPRTTLLEVLRYQFDLTGAKPVCTDGSSGAATVMLDGKPIQANTTLAITCAGKKVQTVESLGGAKPDAVPRAFVAHDAEQCGFCTPGFVMAVRAFLDKNPKATEAEIRSGLNGNLCRCGTYANIIQAATSVVKGG
jgi:xanthine dehydrogenase YagT iron-sulfur-binding subunit